MRVITGDYKGRKLETPYGNDIRPTSDKVKESVFNILMNDTYGRVFCDLFAGTGGLGIEALSRGAQRCFFCDSDREAIRLIKKNIAICGAEERSIILSCDYARGLERIKEKIDVFILDPPYEKGIIEKALAKIENLDLLNENGIILTEHRSGEMIPDSVGCITKYKTRRYGKTTLSIFRRAEDLMVDVFTEE